ncbi:elongin-A-like [Monodelphis domestica]|uniref:elongin-A-like n=1 Tax=Monodelphis domestica TaxID=13616 RepID=UPI0000F2E5F9|nr:elongin-A-like [Monodelphis domestica]
MAEVRNSSLLEVVGHLMARLPRTSAPRKLLRRLKKLSGLPLTLEILTWTGLGKTVSALQKYERVAIFARGLLDRWKKLGPVIEPEANKPTNHHSRKRTHDGLLKQRKVEGDGRKRRKTSRDPSLSRLEGQRNKYPKLDKNVKVSLQKETQERAKGGGEDLKEGRGKERCKKKEVTGKEETQETQKPPEAREKGVARAKGESREGAKGGKVGTPRKGETREVRTGGKGMMGEKGTRGKVETKKVVTKEDRKMDKKEGKIRNGKRSGNHFSLLPSTDCEFSDKCHVLLSQTFANPQQVFMDYDNPQENKADEHNQVIKDQERDNPKRYLVKPEMKMAAQPHHQSKGHKSSPGKVNDKEKGRSFELSLKKLPEGSGPSSRISPKEKQAVPLAAKRKKKPGDSSDKKKSVPPSEMAIKPQAIKNSKVKGALKTKVEKSMLSGDSLHGETQKGEFPPEKKSKAFKANKAPFPIQEESEEEDGFEKHKMSFESYLLYDQPKKKKVKTPASFSKKEGHPKLKSVKPYIKTHSTVPEPPTEKSRQPNNYQAGTSSANASKDSDVIQALSAPASCSSSICETVFSVPTEQNPLSSGELTPPALPEKRQVASTLPENQDAQLPPTRVNSEPRLYSGPRNKCPPKMCSLYEQCIKVLGKNLDLIYEVGQVPYDLLRPVLERCSPKELYRIEEYNPTFLEDSDSLWKIHCSRDFRNEQPEEFESWREMYLRLHDAQEQRLRHLTQSIQLAQAQRPKVRQAKMIFISPVSKSPNDVLGLRRSGVRGAMVLQNPSVKAIQHKASDSANDCAQAKNASNGPSMIAGHSAQLISSANPDNSTKAAVKNVGLVVAKSFKTSQNRFAQP